MTIKKISNIKQYQKPQDSIFSTLITRKISRIFTFYLLKFLPKITPNQISTISFILSLIACLLFLNQNYFLRLFGIVLLQIGFALDCSDGEIARIKKLSSKFGATLDSIYDRLKEVILFLAIGYFSYTQIHNKNIIIIALINIVIWLLISFIRESKKAAWPNKRTAEFFITKNIYIGTVDVIIYLISFAVLFKIEFYIIWFSLFLASLIFIKQLIGLRKYK